MKKVIITIILIIAGLQINQQFETAFKQDIKHPEPKERVYTITVTMYNAVAGQCDSDPFTTADGSKINPERASEQKMVALSRDLLKRFGGDFDYGDLVEIKGTGKKDGIYRVSDTMNKRIKGTMDILETEGTKLYKFENITLKKVCVSSCLFHINKYSSFFL